MPTVDVVKMNQCTVQKDEHIYMKHKGLLDKSQGLLLN
jgi:hypothetical protein